MTARARSTDPITSHEAAGALTDDVLRASQADVLAVLRDLGEASDAELVEAYQLRSRWADEDQVKVRPQSPSGIRTRRKELTTAALVADTGKRVTMPSGRRAIVWAPARVSA